MQTHNTYTHWQPIVHTYMHTHRNAMQRRCNSDFYVVVVGFVIGLPLLLLPPLHYCHYVVCFCYCCRRRCCCCCCRYGSSDHSALAMPRNRLVVVHVIAVVVVAIGSLQATLLMDTALLHSGCLRQHIAVQQFLVVVVICAVLVVVLLYLSNLLVVRYSVGCKVNFMQCCGGGKWRCARGKSKSLLEKLPCPLSALPQLLQLKEKSAKSQATLNWDFSCFSSAIAVAVFVVIATRYCCSWLVRRLLFSISISQKKQTTQTKIKRKIAKTTRIANAKQQKKQQKRTGKTNSKIDKATTSRLKINSTHTHTHAFSQLFSLTYTRSHNRKQRTVTAWVGWRGGRQIICCRSSGVYCCFFYSLQQQLADLRLHLQLLLLAIWCCNYLVFVVIVSFFLYSIAFVALCSQHTHKHLHTYMEESALKPAANWNGSLKGKTYTATKLKNKTKKPQPKKSVGIDKAAEENSTKQEVFCD